MVIRKGRNESTDKLVTYILLAAFVAAIIGVFVLLAINPPLVLTVVGATYLASGPLIALFGWIRRRRADATP